MNMTIRPLRQEEQTYTYAQSQQILMQTGMIGYLRGDFGSGKEFYTTWFDQVESRKTDIFKAELDEVINALRFDSTFGGMLKSRASMGGYCADQEGSALEGNYCTEYGIRVETNQYAYLFRCNPNQGDYNFYCWCYERPWLDRHISNARQGIRFIDSMYREQFRIPDGDKVRITFADGTSKDQVCRYIDEYHMEIGSGLYHICEFAERMEQAGNTVIPLRSSLPEKCFGALQTSREMILIKKGVSGYEHTYIYPEGNMDQQEAADALNDTMGVTKAQTAVMLAGSMFGWSVPAADPKSYDEMGQPILQKVKDRSAR